MDFLLGLIFGFCVGWIALKVIIYVKVKKILESAVEQPPQQKTIKLNFVREKNRIYAYDSETNNFIAHGENKEDIVLYLKQKFPQIGFTANSHNLKEVGLE